jgi:uncharacterized membrane protein
LPRLEITTPLGTAPGSYLFTVRGSTDGTFKTSNDSITMIVEPETEGGSATIAVMPRRTRLNK